MSGLPCFPLSLKLKSGRHVSGATRSGVHSRKRGRRPAACQNCDFRSSANGSPESYARRINRSARENGGFVMIHAAPSGTGAVRKSVPERISVAITEYPRSCIASAMSFCPQAGSQITPPRGQKRRYQIQQGKRDFFRRRVKIARRSLLFSFSSDDVFRFKAHALPLILRPRGPEIIDF